MNVKDVLNEDSSSQFVAPSGAALDNLFSKIPSTAIGSTEPNPDSKEGEEREEEKPVNPPAPKEEEQENEENEEEEENKGGEEKPKTPAKKPESSEDDEDNILSHFVEEFGEVEFPEGEDEFEDDVDAIKGYIRNRDKVVAKEYAKQAITSLYDAFPDVKNLVEHLANGNSIDTFLKKASPDFQPLDLEKAKPEQKENLLRSFYKDKGFDDDDIETFIEADRDAGRVDTKADKANKYFTEKRDKTLQEELEAEQQIAKKQQEEALEHKKYIEESLAKGQIGNLKIGKEQADNLQKFIFGKTKEGKSVREEAWNKLSNDQILLIDYLISNDFKDFKFATDQKQPKVARNIKIKNKTTEKVDLKSKNNANDKLTAKDIRGWFGQE